MRGGGGRGEYICDVCVGDGKQAIPPICNDYYYYCVLKDDVLLGELCDIEAFLCEVEDVVGGTGRAIRWMECGYLCFLVFYRWVERQEQEHYAFDASLSLSA